MGEQQKTGRTQRADKLDAVPDGGNKHLSALFFHELHGKMAGATGARMNQHSLAALKAAMIKESLPGGQHREWHRAGDRCVD